MVSREQRGSAKAINFGILYGMGPQRLSRDLKITMDEGRAFLEAYFREFPKVPEFQKEAVEKARADSYVMTLLGRRRAIPEVHSGDPGIRAQAVKADGSLVHDFLFAESPRSLHVCNAPSPAATSALPIGAYICDKVAERQG